MQEHPRGIEDYYTPEQLFRMVMANGPVDLWVGIENGRIDMAGFSLLEQFAKFRRLQFMWGGGERFREYQKIGCERLEQWAALHQCRDVYVIGHPGLRWLLRDLGFVQKEVTLCKDVTNRWRH
jgi:hypothetical protein